MHERCGNKTEEPDSRLDNGIMKMYDLSRATSSVKSIARIDNLS